MHADDLCVILKIIQKCHINNKRKSNKEEEMHTLYKINPQNRLQ